MLSTSPLAPGRSGPWRIGSGLGVRHSGLGVGSAGLGLAVALLIGAAPLELALPILGGLVLLIGMLIAPPIGLYALLVAVPFSPSLGIEEAGFALSAVEPLALLLLLIWLARGVAHRVVELPRVDSASAARTQLLTVLFALICVLLIASAGATSLPLAIKESLKWVLLFLAFVLTSAYVRTESDARGVLAALFCAGAGQALVGLIQFVGGFGPPTFEVGGFMRAHGNFGQPNPFAGYLGTILPLTLALAAIPHPGRFRTIAWVALVSTGLGIILSLSRGAWLGLLIALAAMALVWSARTRRFVAPTATALVLVGLLGILGALPPALATRVTSVVDNFGIFDARLVPPTPENFGVVERMAHWQAGWEMFLDHPWLGVGPGNYPAVYDRYYISGWAEALGHAHNYYLNMAAEAGLAGLIVLLLFLCFAFRAILRLVSQADRPVGLTRFNRALAVGLLGSFVVFCTHNLFDNLLVHGVSIQIGVLLGLVGGVVPDG